MSTAPTTATTPLTLLLTSKRAVHDAQELSAAAATVAALISKRAVDLLGQRQAWKWRLKAGEARRQILRDIADRMNKDTGTLIETIDATHADRLALLTSLSQTLSSLTSTIVPLEVHHADFLGGDEGANASSLFGLDTDDRHRRRRNERRSPGSENADNENTEDGFVKQRTLRDFIDEESMAALMDELDDEQAKIDVLLSQLSAVPSEFLASITSASSSTKSPSIPPDDIVGPALDARDRLLEEMNADMEGLARHWEQVGDAARLGEEGLQEGELEVLLEDTDHLPLVLDELHARLEALYQIHDSLPISHPHLPSLPPDLSPYPFVSTHATLSSQTLSHLGALKDKLESVAQLGDSYIAYQESFQALLREVEKRKEEREMRESIVRAWEETIRGWEREEGARRAAFMAEWSDALPADLCPSLGDDMESWEIRLR